MPIVFLIFISCLFLFIFNVDYSRLFHLQEQLKILFLSIILCADLFLYLFLRKRDRFLKKIKEKIKNLASLFYYEGEIELEELLNSIQGRIQDGFYQEKKILNENDKYKNLLEENLCALNNIHEAMYYIESDSSKNLISIILKNLKKQKESLRYAIGHPMAYNKFGKNNDLMRFDAIVALVNDDELENFLIQNLFSIFGLKCQIFKSLSFDKNDFNLIFIKDKIFEQISKNNEDFVIFGTHNKMGYTNFLNLPFDRESLEKILQLRLENYKTIGFDKEESWNNVLIFKQNDFENTLFFNIIEKHYSKNLMLSSLFALKQVLKNERYKLVMLDYEVIRYDLEQVKIALCTYKQKNPQSHIIIFSKEKNLNFNFASEILKDINKNDLILMLRKYI